MSRPGLRHPLHGLVRCPYHPEGRELLSASEHSPQEGDTVLRCPECARDYMIEDGIYCLMPDEFREQRVPLDSASDAATLQKRREMQQRDDRASAHVGGFVPHPAGSALEWMNVQYETVTRRVAIPATGVCIDFGTGVGRYIPWLLERGAHVVGTDFSLVSLRKLRAALTPDQQARCLLIQTDMSRLGLASGVATGGLCVGVLQHLPSARVREAAVHEMGRVLSQGADLFIVTRAHIAASRLSGTLKLVLWRMRRVVGGRSPRPLVDQETIEGAIYTYRYTYSEIRQLVRSHFVELEARGIIAFGTFPLTLLPRTQRYRADAWMEGSRFGRLFGQDILLHLQRDRRLAPG